MKNAFEGLSPEEVRRQQRIWRELIAAQDGKCGECGQPVTLESSAKRPRTFKIICQECYQKAPVVLVVYDDLEPEAGL